MERRKRGVESTQRESTASARQGATGHGNDRVARPGEVLFAGGLAGRAFWGESRLSDQAGERGQADPGIGQGDEGSPARLTIDG